MGGRKLFSFTLQGDHSGLTLSFVEVLILFSPLTALGELKFGVDKSTGHGKWANCQNSQIKTNEISGPHHSRPVPI